MAYTFLVFKNGKIKRFQPTGEETWRKNERTPAFEYHTMDVDEETALIIQKKCKYDSQKGFVYKSTGDTFEPEFAVKHTTDFRPDDQQKTDERAEMVCGHAVEDSIAFLHPAHQTRLKDVRDYWFQAGLPYISDPKVNNFLEAVEFACYGYIFERFEAIDPETQELILGSIAEADLVWALYCLCRGPAPE